MLKVGRSDRPRRVGNGPVIRFFTSPEKKKWVNDGIGVNQKIPQKISHVEHFQCFTTIPSPFLKVIHD